MLSQIDQSLHSQPARQVQAPAAVNTTSKNSKESLIADNNNLDQVHVSEQGRSLARRNSVSQQAENEGQPSESRTNELTAEEKQVVEQLKQRDREVRAHEMAHLSRAGQYAASGMQFSYQKGPDGRRYAIGGEVAIDISEENTPEETIQKMQVVRAAALAPAEPSGADRRIAAAASVKEAQARQELQAEQNQPTEPTGPNEPGQSEQETTSLAPSSDSSTTPPVNRYSPINLMV